MRCLTCGKRISPMMKECPNCGAMVPLPERPSAKAAMTQRAPGSEKPGTNKPASSKEFDWKSVLTPRESAAPPPFGDPAANRPAEAPPPRYESEEPQEEAEQPAAPVAPAWTQYIFPAIIILWFAFRTFGPEIKRYFGGAADDDRPVPTESATQLPELRSMVLCERIEQNRPVGARDRFSKSKDKLATLFSVWMGDSGAEKIQFNWKPPRGNGLTGAQKVLPLPDAPGNFLVVGELPLGEFTEAGEWNIEVILNGQVVAKYNFTIEP